MKEKPPSRSFHIDDLLDPKFVPTLLALLWLLILASQTRALANSKTSPPVQSTRCSIDPNTATWLELTVLPRIGEVMARRIVEYRETALAAATQAGGRIFQRAEDLDRVRGIGPKTVNRLRPLLTFSPYCLNTADLRNGLR